MRKVDNGKKKKKQKKEKIMMFLVATNVVASRSPERRPTVTPHARANSVELVRYLWQSLTMTFCDLISKAGT